jgi:hypothetical protein
LAEAEQLVGYFVGMITAFNNLEEDECEELVGRVLPAIMVFFEFLI